MLLSAAFATYPHGGDAMKIHTALLVALLPLAGCNSWPGKATVPPPGTGALTAPNPYYQPPATPPAGFTPPTYGAPGAAPAATAPGFGTAAPPNVNLGATAGTNLSWQPVTRQPTITASPNTTLASNGTINPRTTLTSVRGTGSPVTGGLPDITGLPVVPVPGAPQPTTTLQPRAAYPTAAYPPATAPLLAPSLMTPANYTPPPTMGVRSPDPWRGR
jgi:hypothetical protein